MATITLQPTDFRPGDTVTTDFGTITLTEIRIVDNGHTVRQIMSGTKPDGETAEWNVTVRNYTVPSYRPQSYAVVRRE